MTAAAAGGSEVLIAAIGALALMGATAITAFFSQRKHQNAISDAIGTPNGNGNVVQMVERVIHNQGAIEQKLTDLHAQTDQRFIQRSAAFEAGAAPWRDRLVANEKATSGLVVSVDELKVGHGAIIDRLDALVAAADAPGQVMERLDALVDGQVAPKFEAMDQHLDAQDQATADLDAAVEVVREQTAPGSTSNH